MQHTSIKVCVYVGGGGGGALHNCFPTFNTHNHLKRRNYHNNTPVLVYKYIPDANLSLETTLKSV